MARKRERIPWYKRKVPSFSLARAALLLLQQLNQRSKRRHRQRRTFFKASKMIAADRPGSAGRSGPPACHHRRPAQTQLLAR